MCIVIFSKIKFLQTNHGTRKKREKKEKKNTRKMNSQEKNYGMQDSILCQKLHTASTCNQQTMVPFISNCVEYTLLNE